MASWGSMDEPHMMINTTSNGTGHGTTNGVHAAKGAGVANGTVDAGDGAARPEGMPTAHADALWFALVHDSHSAVMILSSDGVVEFANSVACEFLGRPASEVIGRGYSELFDEHHAAERLSLMSQVMKSGNAVAIDGMVRGVAVRSVYRPVPGPQASRVLLTSRLGPTIQPQQAHPEALPIVRARADDFGRLSSLTARELEILRHIGEGLSTADIARKLHRSVKTIEWHRVSLGNKLGVTNRVELARIAIAAGLVHLQTQGQVATGGGAGATGDDGD